MRVLWISRHKPTNKQITELQKKFGRDTDVCVVSTNIKSGQEVLDLMGRYRCDEVVAVLPVNLIAELTSLGVKPLRAVMKRKFRRDGSAEFNFSHYELIENVNIQSKPV